MTLHERDRAVIMRTYARLDLEIRRGQGAYLFDASGRRFLDLFGGLAVNLIGYGHPRVREAVHAQIDRYSHLSNVFPQKEQVVLAESLIERTGYDAVFFCNSGTEANETAIKLSRKWGRARGRHEIIAFENGFHGRTMGALSLMRTSKYRDGYEPFLDGTACIPFNDPVALRERVNDRTCAVFLEFIQGEGGVIPATAEFIDVLSALRQEHGFLLVADEIQSGLGRTGAFLSATHWNIRPDIVLLAKGIGGGLPLGAVLTSKEVSDVFGIGGHGTTFGGNPVACAAGTATLDVIGDEHLIERAAAIGERLIGAFADLQNAMPEYIIDIRGRGCMVGIELAVDARPVMNACLDAGVLLNVTHEKIIRLLPPLILDDAQVDDAISVMSSVLRDHAGGHASTARGME